MSKRYGRNQKRKAREEIATLREAITRENLLTRRFATELDSFKYWESRLNDAIPRYSALRRKASVEHMKHHPGGEYNYQVLKSLTFEDIQLYHPECQNVEVNRLRLNVMEVKSEPDVYDQALRIRLIIGEGSKRTIAYAVSDDVLAARDFSDEQEVWLADNIAREMSQRFLR